MARVTLFRPGSPTVPTIEFPPLVESAATKGDTAAELPNFLTDVTGGTSPIRIARKRREGNPENATSQDVHRDECGQIGVRPGANASPAGPAAVTLLASADPRSTTEMRRHLVVPKDSASNRLTNVNPLAERPPPRYHPRSVLLEVKTENGNDEKVEGGDERYGTMVSRGGRDDTQRALSHDRLSSLSVQALFQQDSGLRYTNEHVEGYFLDYFYENRSVSAFLFALCGVAAASSIPYVDQVQSVALQVSSVGLYVVAAALMVWRVRYGSTNNVSAEDDEERKERAREARRTLAGGLNKRNTTKNVTLRSRTANLFPAALDCLTLACSSQRVSSTFMTRVVPELSIGLGILASLSVGFANVVNTCSYNRFCTPNRIDSESVLLAGILPISILAPMRCAFMVPLYLVGTAVVYLLYWIPGVPYRTTEAALTPTMVLLIAETVVSLGSAAVREQRQRRAFEIRWERMRREREARRLHNRVERIARSHIPLELIVRSSDGVEGTENSRRRTEVDKATNPPLMLLSSPRRPCAVLTNGFAVFVRLQKFEDWATFCGPSDVVSIARLLHSCVDDVLDTMLLSGYGKQHCQTSGGDDLEAGGASMRCVKIHSLGPHVQLIISRHFGGSAPQEPRFRENETGGPHEDDDGDDEDSATRAFVVALALQILRYLDTALDSAQLQPLLDSIVSVSGTDARGTADGTASRRLDQKVMPHVTIVEGRCGFMMDSLTKNVVGFGDAVLTSESIADRVSLNCFDEFTTTINHLRECFTPAQQFREKAAAQTRFKAIPRVDDDEYNRENCVGYLFVHPRVHGTVLDDAHHGVSGVPSVYEHWIKCLPPEHADASPGGAVHFSLDSDSRDAEVRLSVRSLSPSCYRAVVDDDDDDDSSEVDAKRDPHDTHRQPPPPPPTEKTVLVGFIAADALPPMPPLSAAPCEGVEGSPAPSEGRFSFPRVGSSAIERLGCAREGSSDATATLALRQGLRDATSSLWAGSPSLDPQQEQEQVVNQAAPLGKILRPLEAPPATVPASALRRDLADRTSTVPSTAVAANDESGGNAFHRAQKFVQMRRTWLVFFLFDHPETEREYQALSAAKALRDYEFYLSATASTVSLLALIVANQYGGTPGISVLGGGTMPRTAFTAADDAVGADLSGRTPIPWFRFPNLWCVLGVVLSVSIILARRLFAAHDALTQIGCTVATYAAQVLYLAAVFLAPLGTIVGNSQTVFVVLSWSWSLHRPMNLPLPVLISWDVFVGVLLVLRQALYIDDKRQGILFVSFAFPFATFAFWVVRDFHRRELFAMEKQVQVLVTELERDYRRLEGLLDHMVPSGLVGQLVRRVRQRQRQQAGEGAEFHHLQHHHRRVSAATLLFSRHYASGRGVIGSSRDPSDDDFILASGESKLGRRSKHHRRAFGSNSSSGNGAAGGHVNPQSASSAIAASTHSSGRLDHRRPTFLLSWKLSHPLRSGSGNLSCRDLPFLIVSYCSLRLSGSTELPRSPMDVLAEGRPNPPGIAASGAESSPSTTEESQMNGFLSLLESLQRICEHRVQVVECTASTALVVVLCPWWTSPTCAAKRSERDGGGANQQQSEVAQETSANGRGSRSEGRCLSILHAAVVWSELVSTRATMSHSSHTAGRGCGAWGKLLIGFGPLIGATVGRREIYFGYFGTRILAARAALVELPLGAAACSPELLERVAISPAEITDTTRGTARAQQAALLFRESASCSMTQRRVGKSSYLLSTIHALVSGDGSV